MKYPIIILLLLGLLCNEVTAQKDVPAYGKIEKADLEMTTCSFDNSAEALVLFDVGEVYCKLDLNSMSGNVLRSEFSKHVRIKIFAEKGFKNADIKIRYYSDHQMEDIKNISAQTINLDASGNIVYTKVDKNLIYRKKINKRYSDVIFSFPEVKKGSIIEFKFTDDADQLYAVKNWYFQKPIPVKLSRYTMNFPNELIVNATHQGGLSVDTKEEMKGIRNIKTYTMMDVPALRDEAYITCDEDYQQQVIPIMQALDLVGQPRRNLISTWPKIIKELMEDEDFGLQLKKNIPRTADLDLSLTKITDPYQKMVIIHEYVRKNMQWNDYFGIWAFDGVKSAWKDKKGTAGEINLILVNLLRDADLTVHPVLVSTRENGRVNTAVAGISQFNKVMAYVEIDKTVYVLDATDKFTPAKLIPYEVLNSEGLVIEKAGSSDWGWRTLWNKEKLYKNTTLLMADIDEKGIMTGVANISSFDYSRLERMPALKKGKQLFTGRFLNTTTGYSVDSFSVENEDVDSLALNQRVNFTGKTSSSGGYQYFSANLFSGLEKNPFIADNRFSDVFFGTNQQYNIIGNFNIPDGYQFDELPKNMKMIMPDTSIVFSRMMAVNGGQVSVRMQLEIKKPFYSTEEYPYFQEFYKKLFEMLNEQIVFKKK